MYPISVGAPAPRFDISSSLHSSPHLADGPVDGGGSQPPTNTAMAAASRSDMWIAIVHAVGRHMGVAGSDFLSPAEIIKGL